MKRSNQLPVKPGRFIALDVVDPAAVQCACAEKGITVKQMYNGKGLLLIIPDGTEEPQSAAVKVKMFKMSRAYGCYKRLA